MSTGKTNFWLSVILIFIAVFFINSIDLSNPLKLSAQTQVVGEGVKGYLAKWIPTGATTGAIAVNALLDGSPWTGSANYSISGPSPVASNSYPLPQTHTDRNAGSYVITYNSGSPAGATFSNITPSATQTLSAGGTITFTLSFTTAAAPTLTISPSSVTVGVGNVQQYTATYDSDGSGPNPSQNVTNSASWSSGSASIATVNSAGLATGVAVGSATITASYSGLTANAGITVQAVAGPTLSVILTAEPATGNAPLNSTITATVGGTAAGMINYTFYCDRNDSGTNITVPNDGKFDGIPETTKTITCSYGSIGTYYPKIIIERGSLAATDVKTVVVSGTANQPPTIPQFNAPTVSASGSLTSDCRINDKAVFSWTYSDLDGDSQSAFQIQVVSGTSIVRDTGQQFSSSASYEINDLPVGTYYAQIKVWDSKGAESVGWKISSQFTISSVQAVNFSWSPSVPLVNQPVSFSPQTTIPISSYHWAFEMGDPLTSDESSPSGIKFYSMGSKKIDLSIVSGTNGCIVSKTLVIGGEGPF